MKHSEVCMIILALAVVAIVAWCLQRPQEAFRKPYRELCGLCLPSEADPNIWEQKCIVHNGQQYPLLYYTMTKTCSVCRDQGNGIKSCQNFQQPGNVYQGTVVTNETPSICM